MLKQKQSCLVKSDYRPGLYSIVMLSKQQLTTSHKQCICHEILSSNMCKISKLFSCLSNFFAQAALWNWPQNSVWCWSFVCNPWFAWGDGLGSTQMHTCSISVYTFQTGTPESRLIIIMKSSTSQTVGSDWTTLLLKIDCCSRSEWLWSAFVSDVDLVKRWT